MGMVVNRFEVWLVTLNPTVGREIRKTRPSLIISPDEMNLSLGTVVVAPMTTKGKVYPTRAVCRFQGKAGHIALDQIRTVDQVRLVRKLGRIDSNTSARVLEVLQDMFAP